MSHNTPTHDDTSTDHTTIRRLGIVCLALTIAISAIVIGSGAAAAHPSPDYSHVEDPGNELGQHDPAYDDSVEDHGYMPAPGVQEGPLSDGYGGGWL